MKKLLVLALAVSVMFTVARTSHRTCQRQWNGESRTGPAEEHQGHGEG